MKRFASALSSSYVALLAQLSLQLWFLPHLLDSVGSRLAGVYLSLIFFLGLIGLSVGWVAAPASNLIARAEAAGRYGEASRIFGAVTQLFVGTALLIFLLVALFGSSVIEVCFHADSPLLQHELTLTVLYGGIQFIFVWLFAADVIWLRAKLHDASVSALRLLGTIAVFVSLLLIEGKWTIPNVMAAQIVGPLVSYLGGKVFIRFVGGPEPRLGLWPDLHAVRDLLRVVGPGFAFMSLLQSSAASLDSLVIGALVGAHAVTDMTVIFKIGDVAALLVERALDVVIPFIAKLEAHARSDSIRRLYITGSRFLLGLGIVGATLYSFFALPVAVWWVGSEHVPALRSVFTLASFVLLTRVLNRWEIAMEIAHTSVDGLARRQLTEVVLRLVLFAFLLPAMGVEGALLAMCLSQLFAFLFLYRLRVLSRVGVQFKVYLVEVGVPGVVAGVMASATIFYWGGGLYGAEAGILFLAGGIALSAIVATATLFALLLLLERAQGLIPLRALSAALSEASQPNPKAEEKTFAPPPLA